MTPPCLSEHTEDGLLYECRWEHDHDDVHECTCGVTW